MEETFDHALGNEKDLVSPICRYRTNLGDFRNRRTMIPKAYINGHENGRKSLKGTQHNEWMNFSPTCRQKPERQCSTMIYCQRNSIFHRQKKIIVFIIWPAKIGVLVSGLKNIWPVIMTGDLLSVILSPGNEQKGVLIARIPFLSPQSPPFSPYLPIPKPVRAKHRTDHWNRSRTRKTNNITVKFYGQLHQYLCLLLLSCSL